MVECVSVGYFCINIYFTWLWNKSGYAKTKNGKGYNLQESVRLRIPRLRKRQAIRISKASNRFKSHQIASASKWPKVSNRLGMRPPPRGQQSASTTWAAAAEEVLHFLCAFLVCFPVYFFLSSWYFFASFGDNVHLGRGSASRGFGSCSSLVEFTFANTPLFF